MSTYSNDLGSELQVPRGKTEDPFYSAEFLEKTGEDGSTEGPSSQARAAWMKYP
jgi:hypothetical protein